jgi:hypothetical protein
LTSVALIREVSAMTMPNLQDERIAWLAVRDELRSRAIKTRGVGLMRFVRGINRSESGYRTVEGVRDDMVETRMMKFAVAADELVAKFSIEERFMLRAVGRVPEWYLDAIVQEAKRIRM